MTKDEKDVLLYFLKAGYSTRELEKKRLGLDPKRTIGFESWEILKKYHLRDEDKQSLFIYGQQQALNIISQIPVIGKTGAIDILIKSNRPNNIEKYHNSFLLADSEDSLEKILSGETRNIIRDFFLPQKRLIGQCQFKNCNIESLDTCHFRKSRPEIFKNSASKFRKNLNGLYLYDLYNIFKDYLESHKIKKSVCFLCKEHHNQLAQKEKQSKTALNKFSKNIEWLR